MAIAANSPTERAQHLLKLTERLTSLMEKEVELLNKRQPLDIKTFEDERNALTALYSQEMRLIKQDRTLIEGISRDLRDALKDATRNFQAALAAHELVIGRLRTMSEKLIKAVADDVAKRRAPTLGYGKSATLNQGRRPSAVPLAVNQTA